MTNQSIKKGFTLIEIVIVLAIAALIMVVVFLAVQGAQRAQRDQFRKSVANQVSSATVAFAGNHNGTQPVNPADIAGYIPNLTSNGITMVLPATNAAVSPCNLAANHTTIWFTTATNNNVLGNVCLESGDVYTGGS